MSDLGATRDQSYIRDGAGGSREPVPGLVLVFSGRTPRFAALPLQGGTLMLGRGEHGDVTIHDTCMSRKHALVRFDDAGWAVQDLGSRNGTAVDGEPAPPRVWKQAKQLVRMGDSLFLPAVDVRPLLRAEVLTTQDGQIMGPQLQRAFQSIGRAAQSGASLHVAGESGVGKESAARAFHRLGPCAEGPFIAVNCAAIPEGIAERLLFGATRGAYSGATGDAEGYVQAADGGTLFLDEIAELDLAVQAKLLRVLESREVLALGATRPRPVRLRVCSATHQDLRAKVAEGRLREDLYFRIGRPEVVIPPLRERAEEIPWLVTAALARAVTMGPQAAPNPGADLWPHVSLVEACIERPWPGNVRELLTEIHAAAQEAIASSCQKVESRHLGLRAGAAFAPAPPRPSYVSAPQSAPEPVLGDPPQDRKSPEVRALLNATLQQTGGNISQAARVLGMHRTQLRRLMKHHAIDARTFPRLPTVPLPQKEPSDACDLLRATEGSWIGALATLASIKLQRGRTAEALSDAAESISAQEAVGFVAPRQARAFVVRAEALDALGDVTGARAAIAAGREVILARAGRIEEPDLRQGFLRNIADHARILDLYDAWH